MSTSNNLSKGTSSNLQQQARDMTRNILLGLPRHGPAAGSAEEVDLQAAEAFIGDIQREIEEYDMANARAMQAYTHKLWERVPWFSRSAATATTVESTVPGDPSAMIYARPVTETVTTSSSTPSDKWHGGLQGLDTNAAASALHSAAIAEHASASKTATGAAGMYLHKHTSQTSRGLKVERTSALDRDSWQKLMQTTQKTPSVERVAESSAHSVVTPAARPMACEAQFNSWLFKRRRPGWVPLIQRWWVPWMCMGCMALVWTPDMWKLRTLYYCDYQYSLLQCYVFRLYFRMTMKSEDYAKMASTMASNKPAPGKKHHPDCPF